MYAWATQGGPPTTPHLRIAVDLSFGNLVNTERELRSLGLQLGYSKRGFFCKNENVGQA
jgi:hypothetical protein